MQVLQARQPLWHRVLASKLLTPCMKISCDASRAWKESSSQVPVSWLAKPCRHVLAYREHGVVRSCPMPVQVKGENGEVECYFGAFKGPCTRAYADQTWPGLMGELCVAPAENFSIHAESAKTGLLLRDLLS